MEQSNTPDVRTYVRNWTARKVKVIAFPKLSKSELVTDKLFSCGVRQSMETKINEAEPNH